MLNRSSQTETPQSKKGKDYDDNCNGSRSSGNHDCQGCKCEQPHGDGQVTLSSNMGKKIRAMMLAVLTKEKKG